MRVVTAREYPHLVERADEACSAAWPEYNLHGDVLNQRWNDLAAELPDFQLVLYDEAADIVRAVAYSIPASWDRTVDGLPGGIDAVFELGFALHDAGQPADVLSALAIVVPAEHRGTGLSGQMIAAMRDRAVAHGLGDVIVPLRPVWKERYPLTPIERYVAWTREDGLPFDPWIRTHVRLGGEILRPAPWSLRITGTVGEWEEWTGLALPDDGSYVIPHGLALLHVDHRADVGRYWEPNVWIRHRPGGAPAGGARAEGQGQG